MEEVCEDKSTRPSEDAVFLRKEIIDALQRSDERMDIYSKKTDEKMFKFDEVESYSNKTDDKMDKFLQTITESVGNQLHGMNITVAKMKEEGENRYKQIKGRIANMQKEISVMDEKVKTETRIMAKL